MFLITSICDWKCCKESGLDISVCQNHSLVQEKSKIVNDKDIYERYIQNPITKAIVIGGLEPFDQFEELYNLIFYFKIYKECNDPFVIYTGYYPEEIHGKILFLKSFENMIVKFGRYIPDKKSRYDEVLGVTLASDNQFAEKIS